MFSILKRCNCYFKSKGVRANGGKNFGSERGVDSIGGLKPHSTFIRCQKFFQNTRINQTSHKKLVLFSTAAESKDFAKEKVNDIVSKKENTTDTQSSSIQQQTNTEIPSGLNALNLPKNQPHPDRFATEFKHGEFLTSYYKSSQAGDYIFRETVVYKPKGFEIFTLYQPHQR